MSLSRKYPILTQEEETKCLSKWQTCSKSYESLMCSHMRLVTSIAKDMIGYGLPLEDLIQEGNIGLIKAIKNFDATKGCRLNGYATYYIRSEMLNYVINNFKLIKIANNKAQRKLFFNFKKLKTQSMDVGISKTDIENIAKKLNVPLSEVSEIEQSINYSYVHHTSEDGEEWIPCNRLEYSEKEYEHSTRLNWLQNKLTKLDDRTSDIIVNRHMVDNPATFEQLATKHNISFQRVQQIEKSAIKKLQEQATYYQ